MVNTLIISSPHYTDLKDLLSQFPSAVVICETDTVAAFVHSIFSRKTILYKDIILQPTVNFNPNDTTYRDTITDLYSFTPLKEGDYRATKQNEATNLDLSIITILSIQEKFPLLMSQAMTIHKYIMDFYHNHCTEWPPQLILTNNKNKYLEPILQNHINSMLKCSLRPPQFTSYNNLLNSFTTDVDMICLDSGNFGNIAKNAIDGLIKSAKHVIKKPHIPINNTSDHILQTFNTYIEELIYLREISTDKEVVIISNDESFKKIYSASAKHSSKRSKAINLILDYILGINKYRLDPILDCALKDLILLSEMHNNKTDFITMIKSHLDISNKIIGDNIYISSELETSLNKLYIDDYKSAISFISSTLEDNQSPILSIEDAVNLPAKSFIIQGANEENWRRDKQITRYLKDLIKRADVRFTRSINSRDSLCEEAKFLSELKVNKLISDTSYIQKAEGSRPNPTPTLKDRPLTISPTAIETLIRNPYAYYAKYILRLNEKKETVEFFREFGKIMHYMMDKLQRIEDFRFFDEIYKIESEKIVNQSPLDQREKVIALRRLANIKLQIFIFLNSWSINSSGADIESVKYKDFSLSDGTVVKIKAIPDRVDHMKDGSIRITDYKTGLLPSQQEVNSGYYPQLPIEGLIYNDTSSLFYVGISGMVDKFDIKKISCNHEDVSLSMRNLMEMFLSSQSQGYFASTSEDIRTKVYNHLSRLEEWKYRNENINKP